MHHNDTSGRRSVGQRVAVIVAALLATGCYSGLHDGPGGTFGSGADAGDSADDGGDGAAGDGDGDGGGADDGAAAACEDGIITASAAPLRRLTREQYENTIRDVLGQTPGLDEALHRLQTMVDGKAGAFAATTTAVDAEVARSYLLMAEDLVATYATTTLADDLTCDWAATSCLEELLATTGRRLFRRSLLASEQQAYVALYEQVRGEFGAQAAIRDVLTALLASPSFVYIEEAVDAFDASDTIAPLSPLALASRMSYFLWGNGPDDELLDLAENGSLVDPAVRESQVARMMADDRFGRTLASFHIQLMNVQDMHSFQSSDPDWNQARGQAMEDEVGAFARYVFTQDDAKLSTLLTASYSFVDEDLAQLYGVAAPTTPFGRVELDPAERSGLLTQSGFLAHRAELFPTVHRGLLVRRNLLCDELADPPADLELDPSIDRLEQNPCKACHAYMDTLGAGFNHYDAMGRFSLDGPDSAEGYIARISEGTPDTTFVGAPELGQLLADSPRVQLCMATQWSRYATGRPGTPEDSCTMESLGTLVAEADGDLRELITSLALSRWFASRSTADFSE